MNEQLTLNGVPFDSLAHGVPSIASLLRVPGRRGENVIVPGRHGRIRQPGKRFDANEIVLPIWTAGCLPDGSIPVGSNARTEFFRRRRELLRLLYADPLIVAYTPDEDVFPWIQAEVEVADILDFERLKIEPFAQVSVALEIFGAFWEDTNTVSQDISGPTGTVTALDQFADATAPIADAVGTVIGPCNNPQFVHGSRWVRYNGVVAAGRQLTMDYGTWQLGPGAGAAWTPDVGLVEQGAPGPWFELDPATVPFEVTFNHTTGSTATATISGRRKYLAP